MTENKRVGLIDEMKGFAILCMVVYHAMFDLKYMAGINVPIFFDSWFNIVRDIFAGMFIFVSGTACNYSHNNIKRGVQCFFLGMVLTLVTSFTAPESPITFGILHCLGISMIIYGLCEKYLKKIPTTVGFIVGVFLFAMTLSVPRGNVFGISGILSFPVPDALFTSSCLFPFGITQKTYSALDYFPLMPWLFLFLSGSYFGIWVKGGKMPGFVYKTHIKWLALTGKYTIWIYMLHQPVVYGIIWLIFIRK